MYYHNQSFFIMGLSRSGISAADFLLSRGAKVYLFDDVDSEAVKSAEGELAARGAVVVNKETLKTCTEEADILVLSPGIPVDHPLPVAFRRMGKRVLGESELGVSELKNPLVAVTGTNGKTTTVTMLESIFKHAYGSAVACGNVGKPVTAALKELHDGEIAVAEISSFQLETLTSLKPHVALVLNVTEDHLNRHYNMENYIYLKSRILKNLTESEYAVLNYDDPVVRGFAEKTKAKTLYFSLRERVDGAYLSEGFLCFMGEKILSAAELPLDGDHNLSNALAAIAVARLMGASGEQIAYALKRFQGVCHRLQRVGVLNGVSFIDDSKATNVDSAVKAIHSVKGETVLLLGGKDKGYSYEPLFDEIKNSSVVHCVIYGENAFKILSAALKANYTAITLCRPFDLAVRVAYLTAVAGQNVLLSPASASFDAFSSYEERGERFKQVMEALKAESELHGEAEQGTGAEREEHESESEA